MSEEAKEPLTPIRNRRFIAAPNDDYSVYQKKWEWGTDFWITHNRLNVSARCYVLDKNKTEAYISELYVAPEHRGNRLSYDIMKYCEAVIMSQRVSYPNIESISIWCSPSLMRLYSKMGYVYEKEKDDENVWMTKSPYNLSFV